MRYITFMFCLISTMALGARPAKATQPDPAAYPEPEGAKQFKPEAETEESWRSLAESICSGPADPSPAKVGLLGLDTAAGAEARPAQGWSTETVAASGGGAPDAQYLLIDFTPWTLTDEDWSAYPYNERFTEANSRGYCTVTAYDLRLKKRAKLAGDRRLAAIKGLGKDDLEAAFDFTQRHQALGRGKAGDPYYRYHVFPRSVFKQVNYRSTEYMDAPMPFSVRLLEERGIYLHRGGIHHETDSAGCIRLGLCDSMAFYDWVGKVPLRVEFRFPWTVPDHAD